MMMFFALPFGILLGIFFYGGLWFTVRHLAASRHPVVLTLSSFWLRMLVVLAGFVFMTRGSWQDAVICLAGVLAGRIAVSKFVAGREPGTPRCT